MWKKLTLFCTFAIFMLAVGGAVTPVWAHANCDDPGGKGKHSPNHPHCGVVNEDSTDDGNLYLVWVDGVCVNSGSGQCLNSGYGVCGGTYAPLCTIPVDDVCVEWFCESEDVVPYDTGIPPYIGHDPVGNFEKNVAVVVNLQHIDMDLTFLREAFDVDSDGDGVSDGDACFGRAPVEGRQTVLEISQEEDETMAAVYVFSGYGYGTDIDKNVGYRVNLSSEERVTDEDLIPEWRPTGTGDRLRFDAVFDHWEMGGKRRNRCINGSGLLNTTISIEFLPPPS